MQLNSVFLHPKFSFSMIYQICITILDQIEKEHQSEFIEKDISGIIEKIRDYDSEIADVLFDLKSKNDIHQFVNQDGEMRSKLKDLWQLQSDRTRQDRDLVLRKLRDITQFKNISLPSEL
jgi:hypothetical protein